MNEIMEIMRLIEISQRIDTMRYQYKQANHYDRFYIFRDAKELQKGLNRSIGHLKTKVKKKYYYDDFIVLLIDKVY